MGLTDALRRAKIAALSWWRSMPEKKESCIWKSFHSVHLRREDLLSIIEILGGIGPVGLSDDEFAYSDIGDLEDARGSSIRSLVLHAMSSGEGLEHDSVTVTFNSGLRSSAVSMYGSRDSDGVIATISRVAGVLKRRERLLPGLIIESVTGMYVPVVVVSLIAVVHRYGESIGLAPWIRVAFAVLGIVSLAAVYLNGHGVFVRIDLRPRSEAPSFWARQKDDILKMLLAAGLGALVTYLLS